MRTLILAEPGRLELIDTPAPSAPPPGHALVRVHRVGVCGTDLHAYRGRQPFFTYPRILGHELGVEVVSLNPVDTDTLPVSPQPLGAVATLEGEPLQPGDRCAVEAYLNCGQCIACRRGKPNCCVRIQYFGVHIDGGLRPFLVVPIHKLHRADLSLDQLALVEMLTIGAHAVDRAQLEADDTVLVIGVGPIGLSVVQFAQAAGVRLIALDVDTNRLAFAHKYMGVPHTVAVGPDARATIESLTDGDFPTVVFDATGNPASMSGAIQYLAHGGRLVFVGHHTGEIVFQNPEFHRREATVLATRNSVSADYHRVLGMIAAGQVNTNPWITHRAAFDDVPTTFPTWLLPETRVIKAVIDV